MIRIAILFIVLFPTHSIAENLCASEKEHDLIIGEEEFTMENALKAINNLDHRIYKLIIEHGERQIVKFEESLKNNQPIDTSKLRENLTPLDTESYIGIPNRLSIIRGALLKQNALALKNNGNETEYELARIKFCYYAKDASYVD